MTPRHDGSLAGSLLERAHLAAVRASWSPATRRATAGSSLSVSSPGAVTRRRGLIDTARRSSSCGLVCGTLRIAVGNPLQRSRFSIPLGEPRGNGRRNSVARRATILDRSRSLETPWTLERPRPEVLANSELRSHQRATVPRGNGMPSSTRVSSEELGLFDSHARSLTRRLADSLPPPRKLRWGLGLAAACMFGLLAPAAARSQESGNLTGRWVLNRNQSQVDKEVRFNPVWLVRIERGRELAAGFSPSWWRSSCAKDSLPRKSRRSAAETSDGFSAQSWEPRGTHEHRRLRAHIKKSLCGEVVESIARRDVSVSLGERRRIHFPSVLLQPLGISPSLRSHLAIAGASRLSGL